MESIPTLEQAEQMLAQAVALNPGPWEAHSRCAAQAARAIGARLPGLDPQRAYIVVLLHDIGRRAGVTGMRHVVDGYDYLMAQGFPGAARISMTHSFPVKDARTGSAGWDGSNADFTRLQTYLSAVTYDDYDRLSQLCDTVSQASGYCLIEKRLVDVALRYGVNAYSVEKWRAFLEVKAGFEAVIGESIYRLLPGVVENTFDL